MNNPLKTNPELCHAIREFHQVLARPTLGRHNWLRVILGGGTYDNIVELQDDKAHHRLPDWSCPVSVDGYGLRWIGSRASTLSTALRFA
jgi:hypothetical protein